MAKGNPKRDRAILAVLLGCALRRSELAALQSRHIQQRDGRWVFADLVGKGRDPDGMGHNTMAKSLFEAAAKALHWAEVDCQIFGTARRYRDDQVLDIGVGTVPDRWHRVRIGRVRHWIRETARTDCEGNQ